MYMYSILKIKYERLITYSFCSFTVAPAVRRFPKTRILFLEL